MNAQNKDILKTVYLNVPKLDSSGIHKIQGEKNCTFPSPGALLALRNITQKINKNQLIQNPLKLLQLLPTGITQNPSESVMGILSDFVE